VIAQFDFALARDFGTALLLGALIGIEREKRNVRAGHGNAGLRSFVMLSQVGACAGYLGIAHSLGWVLPAALLGTAMVVVAGYFASTRVHPEAIGLTTELAAIVTVLLGAMATTGHREVAIGLGVLTAALLAYKQPLHDLVGRLGWDDVLVGLRLLLATFIVLPLLPNEPIDPWGAINPYKLWLLVLLISALSLVGYIATRWLGPGRGVAVTAATGGLVSSTAVTLTFVKQSREPGAVPAQLSGGVLLAWAIMFARVLVTATIVDPPLFVRMWPAFVGMALAAGAVAFLCLWRHRREGKTTAAAVPMKNPFSLLAAGKIAGLFAIVQLLLKLGQDHLPQSGIYAVAAIAGLTDVDAITVAMAERARAQPADLGLAVIAIAIASGSNTLVKAGMAAGMGRGLGKFVLPGTAVVLVVGAAVLVLTRA
jgi:uncharacterized membrane protein (DUF4010 family)